MDIDPQRFKLQVKCQESTLSTPIPLLFRQCPEEHKHVCQQCKETSVTTEFRLLNCYELHEIRSLFSHSAFSDNS